MRKLWPHAVFAGAVVGYSIWKDHQWATIKKDCDKIFEQASLIQQTLDHFLKAEETGLIDDPAWWEGMRERMSFIELVMNSA